MLTKLKLPGVIFWNRLGPIIRHTMEMITVTGRGIDCNRDCKDNNGNIRE